MWVAATQTVIGGGPQISGHSTEEEAEVAARDRCPYAGRRITYEIPDEPVLPGWSRREDAAA